MPATMKDRCQIDEWFTDDDKFNSLYAPYLKKLADRHWTPLHVAKYAADFLVREDGVKVLDIGQWYNVQMSKIFLNRIDLKSQNNYLILTK